MTKTTQTLPDQGWYSNVPFETYRDEWPAINNTWLSRAARSMAHFHAYVPNHETAATDFGTLIHCGTLEPQELLKRYAVMPDIASQIRRPDGSEYSNVKASKEYRDTKQSWLNANAAKEVIDQADWDALLGITMALRSHRTASLWLEGGLREVSFTWRDVVTGLDCKGRCDIWHSGGGLLVDLKTCRDAAEFEKDMVKYGYHRQASFYCDGMVTVTGHGQSMGMIVVEKEPPYAVRASIVAPETLAQGRREYTRLLKEIAVCRTTGKWPGYEDPEWWQLPEWAFDEVELKIGGEAIRV